MGEKTFINGLFIREKQFDNGGSIIKVDINVDTLCQQLAELRNDKGFVTMDLKQRREKSENGLTHYAEHNTFVPKAKSDTSSEFRTSDDEDVPF